ncbi:peptidoglycan editing factor PgeF [Bowmanella pacifica]|uniref:Purine nucleoside phosphorylase n=1 Tax=Bowmanella pacifica TaxID=502051 RepID=A0A917YPJ7_9ALTE|nr:peptidoglycan editing factor PgeF [Bowmanella pacifica]GGO63310.1 laccase domain protein [Bowmanella pacifica]
MFIQPDWPAPKRVQAISTTRQGGVSRAPFESLNLGMHVGDSEKDVLANRQQLPRSEQIIWLNQVHGNAVHRLNVGSEQNVSADASIALDTGITCAVMTADCLPVLFCHRQGLAVGAAHAGWRGLAAGVLENTLAALPGQPEDYLVWLGPAIGPNAFEVGEDVKQAFAADYDAFKSTDKSGKFLADIYQLARACLARAGVNEIYGGEYCTHQQACRFFSYRRDGQTGRMASLIWLEDH